MVEIMSMEDAIKYHLEYNFAVPYPREYIDGIAKMCVLAVNAVNEHDLHREIPLPDGVRVINHTRDIVHDHTVPAFRIIIKFKLDQWLNSEWQ